MMKIVQQIKENKVRAIKTLAVYFAFIGNGLCSGISGPTLLDLQIAANSSLEQITWVIPARSGGYAIGSLLGKRHSD